MKKSLTIWTGSGTARRAGIAAALAVVFSAGIAAFNVASAGATLDGAGICPKRSTYGLTSGTDANSCNFVITFNPNGSITTSGPGGNYDGTEDALFGVVNLSGHSIDSFTISGVGTANGLDGGIFSGMEGDGIGSFTHITNAIDAGTSGSPPAGLHPTVNYGGEQAYFTNVTIVSTTVETGTVNFIGGIPNASTGYFSLEDPVNLEAPPTVTPAPEPLSLSLLGVGLVGLGVARRRR